MVTYIQCTKTNRIVAKGLGPIPVATVSFSMRSFKPTRGSVRKRLQRSGFYTYSSARCRVARGSRNGRAEERELEVAGFGRDDKIVVARAGLG